MISHSYVKLPEGTIWGWFTTYTTINTTHLWWWLGDGLLLALPHYCEHVYIWFQHVLVDGLAGHSNEVWHICHVCVRLGFPKARFSRILKHNGNAASFSTYSGELLFNLLDLFLGDDIAICPSVHDQSMSDCRIGFEAPIATKKGWARPVTSWNTMIFSRGV